MPNRNPTIPEMLLVAYGTGLKTVREAFWDYTRQCDLFFNLSHYTEQREALWCDIAGHQLENMTITQALAQLGIPLPDDSGPLGLEGCVGDDIPW